jgi:GNAT superfamily N-acetyltransferase
MLYTGPWHDAIIRLDTAQKVALAQRLAHQSAGTEAGEPFAGSAVSTPNLDDRKPHSSAWLASAWLASTWLGVYAEDDIRAVLVRSPTRVRRGWSSGPAPVVNAALWVDPQWRRRGMAHAMLQQCVANLRQAGVRHLVCDGLESDVAMRKLLRRFSADFIFVNGSCQAWLELGAVAAPVAQPVLTA